MIVTLELARSIKCPFENVQENWPRVKEHMEALNVASELSQLAAIATIAVETAWRFEPIKEFGSEEYLQSKAYYPYFGRGFGQITWEDAYRKYGELLGIPLLQDPDKALDPDVSASIFAAQWRDKGCQALADQGDFRHVRIRWNGGLNEMTDFLVCVERLKEFLPVPNQGGEIS